MPTFYAIVGQKIKLEESASRGPGWFQNTEGRARAAGGGSLWRTGARVRGVDFRASQRHTNRIPADCQHLARRE